MANRLLKGLLFAALVCPVGAFSVSFAIAAVNAFVLWDPGMLVLGFGYAALIAPIFGAAFGALLAWPASSQPIVPLVLYLTAGSLACGLPPALIPMEDGGGMMWGWFGGLAGFWIGAVAALSDPDGRLIDALLQRLRLR